MQNFRHGKHRVDNKYMVCIIQIETRSGAHLQHPYADFMSNAAWSVNRGWHAATASNRIRLCSFTSSFTSSFELESSASNTRTSSAVRKYLMRCRTSRRSEQAHQPPWAAAVEALRRQGQPRCPRRSCHLFQRPPAAAAPPRCCCPRGSCRCCSPPAAPTTPRSPV